MSYTEIFKFNKDGNAVRLGETQNAWRGAMAIWDTIDKKYLPAFVPSWAKDNPNLIKKLGYENREFHRSSDSEALKEVWAVFDSKEISEIDKIVLGSTFDNVIIMREDLPKLIEAYRSFEGNTSLKEQADILEDALKNDMEFLAIAYNHTSVNADCWTNFGGYDENEEDIPYNILTMNNRHWNLFDDIKVS